MKSGLSILFELAKELNLLGHVPQKCVQKDPFWNLKDTAFVSDLTSLKKEDTPAEIYRQMFTEITDNLKKQNWQLLFTDGSHKDESSSFAVVTESGSLISKGVLARHQGVYEAEIQGILSGCELAKIVNKTSKEAIVGRARL